MRNGLDQPELLDLFALSEAQFRLLIQGSAMGRVSYPQWQRNIAIALGNGAGGEEVVNALTNGLGRVNPMVDEHITWALEQLKHPSTNERAN